MRLIHYRREQKEVRKEKKLKFKKNYATIQVCTCLCSEARLTASEPATTACRVLLYTPLFATSQTVPETRSASSEWPYYHHITALGGEMTLMTRCCCYWTSCCLQETVLLWEELRPKQTTKEQKAQLVTQIVKKVCLPAGCGAELPYKACDAR